MPWTDAAISGWVLDPDRKKMSKSKGNVVTPMEPIRQFGADAMRYWAASGRPGVDTAVDEGQIKVGPAARDQDPQRVEVRPRRDGRRRTGTRRRSATPLDQSMLARLHALVVDATAAFDAYDYARALEATERFFWSFCDDYLELVKQRAYGQAGEDGAASARAALALALDTLLRLFAPAPPVRHRRGVVVVARRLGAPRRVAHCRRVPARSPTPTPRCIPAAAAVLGEIRKVKSVAKRSMRTDVTRLVVARAGRATRRAARPRWPTSSTRAGSEASPSWSRRRSSRSTSTLADPEPEPARVNDGRDVRGCVGSTRTSNLETGVGVPARGGVGRRLLAVDRQRPLMELLGSPQLEYPAVHVTGTNGKTSVARMISALLNVSGISVGSYTSPHLQRVNERIAWNGDPIDDLSLDEQLAAVALVEDLLPDEPSYFEILTAAALRWFGDIAVDAAVVEVGLGGTGDATNVVDGLVAVVTNVSIDHVEYIGPTLEDIATGEGGHREAGLHAGAG